jgi:Fe-S-cluster-containing dehydrogenase component
MSHQHGAEHDGQSSCTGQKAEHLARAELLQIGGRTRSAAGAAGDAGNGAGADASRRDFLSLMGFSLGAASVAACRAPVQNAIPLTVASPEMVPGVANHYATTCGGCASACGLVVKQRDGRPIKIEGNDESPLFGGGSCASGQATVLGLYDERRLRGPTWHGKPTGWSEVDQRIAKALAGAEGDKRRVVLLSGTVTSPSLGAVIAAWGRSFPSFRHVAYDAVSSSGLRAATEQAFGRAVVPTYAFERARVVVALEADFLGTWISPVEFARGYAASRRAGGAAAGAAAGRSFHVQIESGMSVTGSNADLRLAVAPSELGTAAVALLGRVARKAGKADKDGAPAVPDPVDTAKLDLIAERLWQHRGESLVGSGSNDPSLQVVVAALNALLGNIGKTVDVARASLQRQGDEGALSDLVAEMNRGEVRALIVMGANPAYDHSEPDKFLAALAKVPLTISLADRRDETSAHVQAVCPDHHFLESWGDAEPVEGYVSLAQPLIAPLHSTRAATESLLRWLGGQGEGEREHDPYRYLRAHWRTAIFPRQEGEASFEAFWDRSLQRGLAELAPVGGGGAPPVVPELRADWKAAAAALLAAKGSPGVPGANLELHLYESVPLRDGRHANNPWLQELPDPITKTTWGNVAAVAPGLAAELGLASGDVVALRAGGKQIELPVFVQPGQHRRTVSVALGHGRTEAGKAGDGVGANAFGMAGMVAGFRRYAARDLQLVKTGRRVLLAAAQSHFSSEGRPLFLSTTAAELAAGPSRPRQGEHGKTEHGKSEHGKGEHGGGAAQAHGGGGHAPAPGGGEKLPSLWREKAEGEHSWGLAIDLDACTGCSACVVACQAENNVPVVGKDQVQRNRNMHWIRIDRYFDGPADDPVSKHQPMLCQHCANAPCETVCPVLATTTSSEGLNQQVYNRCIGTRYCANNCPYKVRRFNWLNYTLGGPHASHMEDPLGRMVLNPDVTVRTRGVMEKCSLCVQRIQLGKNQALKEKRDMRDGDVQTACAQSCPTGAIVFGDLKDKGSRVSRLSAGPRAYLVLEELGTRPNVAYLKKVRQPDDHRQGHQDGADDAHHGGGE